MQLVLQHAVDHACNFGVKRQAPQPPSQQAAGGREGAGGTWGYLPARSQASGFGDPSAGVLSPDLQNAPADRGTSSRVHPNQAPVILWGGWGVCLQGRVLFRINLAEHPIPCGRSLRGPDLLVRMAPPLTVPALEACTVECGRLLGRPRLPKGPGKLPRQNVRSASGPFLLKAFAQQQRPPSPPEVGP